MCYNNLHKEFNRDLYDTVFVFIISSFQLQYRNMFPRNTNCPNQTVDSLFPAIDHQKDPRDKFDEINTTKIINTTTAE